MSNFEVELLKLKLKGVSEEEISWFIDTYGKSCKTCDHWHPIDDISGRCNYFYHAYLENPDFYYFIEPKEQPITTNKGLCEVFSGYREGELKTTDFKFSLSELF
jgi:hypothetical protein